MNLKKRTGKTLLLALILAVSGSVNAFSQSLVMSPRTALTATSSDIAKLVEEAYPAYDDAALEKRLTEAGNALQARPDRVTVRSLAGIEKVLGLASTPSRGNEVDTAGAYYRINPQSGKAFGILKNYTYTGLSADRFGAIEPKVREIHKSFFGTLGLPSDEIMKTSFRRVLAQSFDEKSEGNSDGTPVLVRRGMTLGYRAFAGFPVENAFVRVSSFDSSRVQNFALSWPAFTLHPSAAKVALASKDAIKKNIVGRIAQSSQRGQLLNVVMGVVFRPGRTADGKLVHVPAMKVIVKPSSMDRTGAQTEAGLEFYADVLQSPPALMPDDFSDKE